MSAMSALEEAALLKAKQDKKEAKKKEKASKQAEKRKREREQLNSMSPEEKAGKKLRCRHVGVTRRYAGNTLRGSKECMLRRKTPQE